MALVKYFDKRVGITYVYSSESYYDSEKHQSRSKRKLIGKIDPDTGEIVPTGKRGRPFKETVEGDESAPDYKKMYEKALAEIAGKDKRIASLEQELAEARNSAREYTQTIRKISDLCKAHM